MRNLLGLLCISLLLVPSYILLWIVDVIGGTVMTDGANRGVAVEAAVRVGSIGPTLSGDV